MDYSLITRIAEAYFRLHGPWCGTITISLRDGLLYRASWITSP